MKGIIYEDLFHDKSLFHELSTYFKVRGFDSREVTFDIELEKLLQKGDIDFVIIHHRDFEYLEKLKKKFPNVKLIGYSAFISNSEGLNKYIVEAMEKYYDDVFGDITYVGNNIIPDYEALTRIFGNKSKEISEK